MSNEVYRHWGNDKFIYSYFTPISNNREYSNKPHGGLWSSPINDVDVSWETWCRGEDFMTDRLEKHFDFRLKDNARLLVIKDIKDLDKLPRVNIDDEMSLIHTYCILDFNANIDFEKLKEDYDALLVYMYRSSDISEEDMIGNNTIYYKLYGWDVDTLLVMNPDVIEEV